MTVVHLREVCLVEMGQAPPGDSYNTIGNGSPLIAGAGDFLDGRAVPKKFTTAPSKVSQPGDIVLGIRASIGERVWADREYSLGRGVAGLRPKPGLDSRYLWSWLGYASGQLAAKGRGATFLQVNRRDIEEMLIPLPPLDEQRRIAEILDQADALRAKRRQTLAHLDDLTQSIFLDLFGDPRTWQDRWPMTTIGELAESVMYGSSSKAGSAGAWPMLRMGNVTDSGRLDLTNLKYIDLTDSEVAKYTVRRGDLLFNRTNSAEKVGKTCVVDTDASLAIAGYLIRVRLKEGNRPEFVSAYLNSGHGKAILRGMAKAIVNQANINATEMKSIAIAQPPQERQVAFARRVHEVDASRRRWLTNMTQLNELFASLQSRAFSGQL